MDPSSQIVTRTESWDDTWPIIVAFHKMNNQKTANALAEVDIGTTVAITIASLEEDHQCSAMNCVADTPNVDFIKRIPLCTPR